VTFQPNLTWAIRSEAFELALDGCWFPDQLRELLADRRSSKLRDEARYQSLDESGRIEDLIGDAMERVGLTPAHLMMEPPTP